MLVSLVWRAAALVPAFTLALILSGIIRTSSSQESCQTQCLSFNQDKRQCWAFITSPKCTLFLTEPAHVNGDSLSSRNESLWIRTCFSFEVGIDYVNSTTQANTRPMNCSEENYNASSKYANISFRRFILFRILRSWFEARQNCSALGGRLATVDENVNSFLIQMLNSPENNNFIWIGLHDRMFDSKGDFAWDNCEPLQNFTNWQPNGSITGYNSWCVSLIYNNNWKWNTETCNSNYHYICELDTDLQGGNCSFTETTLWKGNSTGLTSNVTYAGSSQNSSLLCQSRCVSFNDNGLHCWAFTNSLGCRLFLEFRDNTNGTTPSTTFPTRLCVTKRWNNTQIDDMELILIDCTQGERGNGGLTTEAGTPGTSQSDNCECPCDPTRPSPSLNIKEVTEQIKKELTVETKNLSSTRRKKESSPDARKSAVAAGVIGISCLVLVLSLIVVPDLHTMVMFIKNRI